MTSTTGNLRRAPLPTFNLGTIGREPDGATPIDDDDLEDLIPDFVATRSDLNTVEYENIAKAMPWALREAAQGGPMLVLSYSFVFQLHRRMFGDVWRWAGTQRQRTTNIGIEPWQITMQTKQVLDDVTWWHENEVFSVDERAARLHRRLVAVHPFPNGNGRCTRLVADLYLHSVGQPTFTWGVVSPADEGSDARRRYLNALTAADTGSYEPLVTFARS